jgi:CRP/FNR family cyclic AMP-dependent transcriptional regulator
VLFHQADHGSDVLYIRSGNAKLSIVNPQGKEAVPALLSPGDFLGEGCIIGNPLRLATATAIVAVEAMGIEKKEILRVLHDEQKFAPSSFITCLRKLDSFISEGASIGQGDCYSVAS